MSTENTGLFRSLNSVVLRVSNLRKATKWYSEMLGLFQYDYDENEKRTVFMLGDATTITLLQLKSEEFLPPFHFCGSFPVLSTHDARSCYEMLNSKGVHTDQLLTDQFRHSFTFVDLDGNRLGVLEQPASNNLSSLPLHKE